MARPLHQTKLLVYSFIVVASLSAVSLLQPSVSQAAPVRGVVGDTWADIVIGKPDFDMITPFTTVQDEFFLPHGVIIDRNNPSDNKMYVFDSGNSRVLGYDVEDCLAAGVSPLDCQPELVIGQPDFSSSSCNGDSGFQNYPDFPQPTNATLCGTRPDTLSLAESESGNSMDVDSEGNLWMFDTNNNRVLRFNDPFNTDVIADDVWGQDNFTSRECNKGGSPDATTLCYGWGNSNNWTTGVDIDSSGNLWINDSYNNRILRFPNDGGTISKTADLVLGQEDFTSGGAGDGLDQLMDPSAVRVTDEGVVFVADHGNNRVMRYATPTTGGDGEVFGSGFAHPSGIDFDDTQPGRIWISNIGHAVIELWDEDTESLVLTVGRTDDPNQLGAASGSVGFDSNGNFFAATGEGESDNNILVYLKSDYTVDPENFTYRMNVQTRNGNAMDEYGLGSGRGVVVSNDQLIISDLGRILFWNIPNGVSDLTNGKPADGFVNAPSFNQPFVQCCPLIAADESGNLYTVVDTNGDDVYRIEVYQLPLTTSEEPTTVLDYPFDALGGGQVTYQNFFGTFSGLLPAPDSSYIWLSDNGANRVMRLRDPLGPSPVVDVILGQTTLNGTDANMGGSVTDDSLWNPGLLAFDIFDNFYIADDWLEAAGNNRIVIYEPDTFPTDNEEIIYATDPNYIKTQIATWLPAFDPYNKMIVGYNPYFTGLPPEFPLDDRWFPGIYNDLIGGDSVPDAHLSDYFSMGYTTTYDEDHNFYISDINRARVLIYFQPLRGEEPVLTEVTPVPTPSDNTTPEYTFSTTRAGSIDYGGSCSSNTSEAAEGNNTITFAELPPGIYSDCTITVIDLYGQISEPLQVSSFTITGGPTPTPTPSPSPSPSSSPSFGPTSPAAPGGSPPGAPGCTLPIPAGQPDLFEISPGKTSVNLFFSPVLSATDHYFVSYSTDPSAQEFGFEFPLTETGVTSVTIKSLKPNKQYYFKVRAGNGCQPGEWSNILSAKTGQTFSTYRWSSVAMIASVNIARIFNPSAIQQQVVDAQTGEAPERGEGEARPLVKLEVQPPPPPLTPGYIEIFDQVSDYVQQLFGD